MPKFKVYLRNGSVLEVEADSFVGNEQVVYFLNQEQEYIGSFGMTQIFGYYASDKVRSTSPLRGINFAE